MGSLPTSKGSGGSLLPHLFSYEKNYLRASALEAPLSEDRNISSEEAFRAITRSVTIKKNPRSRGDFSEGVLSYYLRGWFYHIPIFRKIKLFSSIEPVSPLDVVRSDKEKFRFVLHTKPTTETIPIHTPAADRVRWWPGRRERFLPGTFQGGIYLPCAVGSREPPTFILLMGRERKREHTPGPSMKVAQPPPFEIAD